MTNTLAHRRKKRGACRVCGAPRNAVAFTESKLVCAACLPYLVPALDIDDYRLVVDGSYVTVSGQNNIRELGHGGAGLVLMRSNEVVCTKICAFDAVDSNDAEREAILRGARWVPDVCILTDVQQFAEIHQRPTPRDIRFVAKENRDGAWELAHDLSVHGRYIAEDRWISNTLREFFRSDVSSDEVSTT